MSASDASIEKLTETVNTLAQALARSEARYRSIEKIYRWMAAGLVGMAALVVYVGSDFITRAYAQSPEAQQIAAAIQQLSERGVALNIGGTLQGIAQLGDMMQKNPAAMQQVGATLGQIRDQLAQVQVAASHARPWGWGMQAAAQGPGLPPPRGAMPAAQRQPPAPAPRPGKTGGAPPAAAQPGSGQQAVVPVTLGEVFRDVGVLLTNLREDSDWLRQFTKPSGTIEQELARMNVALAAVPTMAVEMHKMNIAMGYMTSSMGMMTQSVGSTMGRFGSMWPF